jgi:hypothetical protein
MLTDVSEELTVCIIRKKIPVRSSETSVSIYQSTRRNIPEDKHIHPS